MAKRASWLIPADLQDLPFIGRATWEGLHRAAGELSKVRMAALGMGLFLPGTSVLPPKSLASAPVPIGRTLTRRIPLPFLFQPHVAIWRLPVVQMPLTLDTGGLTAVDSPGLPRFNLLRAGRCCAQL